MQQLAKQNANENQGSLKSAFGQTMLTEGELQKK
jgi:hypothetical protein